MPERLTDSLVQKGLVTRKAADEAIDRQVLMGGALDTCLLELQLIDEPVLTTALADAYATEAASPAILLSEPDFRVTRAFPEQWAKKHVLAPLDMAPDGIRVLSPAPADLDALRRLGELLELRIYPVLAPEFRVRQWLEKLYGNRPAERYQALIDRFGATPKRVNMTPPVPEPVGAIRPPIHQPSIRSTPLGGTPTPVGDVPAPLTADAAQTLPGGVPSPFARNTEPVGVPATAPVNVLADIGGASAGVVSKTSALVSVATNGTAAYDRAEAPAPFVPAPVDIGPLMPHRPGALPTPNLTFGDALAAVNEATTEADVARTIVAYAGQWLRFVTLLRVDGSTVEGWMGRGPMADRIAAVRFDLQDESTFSVVIDTKAHYLGPLPSDQVQSELVSQLKRPAPRMVLIVPIRVRAEPIALLYADNAEAPISPRLASDLLLVITNGQAALEALRPAPTRDDADLDETLESGDPVAVPQLLPVITNGATHETLQSFDDAPIPLLDDLPSGQVEADTPPSWAAFDAIRSDAPRHEPITEPSAVISADKARTDNAVAMPTDADGRFDAVQYRSDVGFNAADYPSAVVAEAADGSDLFSELDETGAPVADEDEEEGWDSVDAGNWDEWEPPEPAALTPAPVVESLRGSLGEDATVPDLSAEAWIRASSEVTRAKPYADEVVQRSSLPDPDSDIDQVAPLDGEAQPVPLTRAMSRPPSSSAEVSGPQMIVLAEDQDDDGELLALDELEQPVPLSEPINEPNLGTLIDDLGSTDSDVRSVACEALARRGTTILPMVMPRFPGVLSVDPFSPQVRLPAFSKCGIMLALLQRFGREAHQYVVGKLDAPDPLHRFFAIYFYGAVYVPEAIPKLIQRLHDEESRICMLAARTLFSYRDHRNFQLVLDHLHGRLSANSLSARRHAAYLIGLFRDVTAIPELMAILERRERPLQDVVEDALAEITKQRLGTSVRRWRSWWAKNRNRSRIEWLLDGLASKDADLRRSASDELSAVTGIDLGFDGHAPRRVREEARQRWLKWWKAQQAKRAVTLA